MSSTRKDHGTHNGVAKVANFQVGWYVVTTDSDGRNPTYSFRGNGDKPAVRETKCMRVRFYYGSRWHTTRPERAKDYRELNRQKSRKTHS